MNSFLLLALFAGILMVVHGVYEEKYQKLRKKKKVVYKFIPRSSYDEMVHASNFGSKFDTVWRDRSEVDVWSYTST